jgi:hypothetical protein
MITLKKSELEPLLLIISSFDAETKKPISGLLFEEITLGTRRKLQRIHKLVAEEYTKVLGEYTDIKKSCGDNKVKLDKEFAELMDEEVKIDIDPISMELIENISTKHNYNFDLIDKISC